MSEQVEKHEASGKKPFPVDPSAAGKAGVQERERRRMERINETREALEAGALKSATRLLKYANNEKDDDGLPIVLTKDELAAVNSVLDRTVGKAPKEISMTVSGSDLAMDAISKLTKGDS